MSRHARPAAIHRRWWVGGLACVVAVAAVLAVAGSRAEGRSYASTRHEGHPAAATITVQRHSTATTTTTTAPTPPTTAPAAVPVTPVTTTHTLTVDGLQRSYLVVAPSQQKGPLPLLVVLHGINASVAGEVGRDEFAPLVAAGKLILLYPAGIGESWNAGVDGCCGQAGQQGVDDVAFISQVVSAAQRTLSVQPGHVYLVGFSNGGKLAYDVMCREPELFDAFAAVAATPLAPCTAASQPPRSVIVTAGSADPELPMHDAALPAARAVADAAVTWRQRDGCAAASNSATVGVATITTWTSCTAGTQVRTVLYAGLTHLWPGTQLVGADDSGAALIWQFLSGQ